MFSTKKNIPIKKNTNISQYIIWRCARRPTKTHTGHAKTLHHRDWLTAKLMVSGPLEASGSYTDEKLPYIHIDIMNSTEQAPPRTSQFLGCVFDLMRLGCWDNAVLAHESADVATACVNKKRTAPTERQNDCQKLHTSLIRVISGHQVVGKGHPPLSGGHYSIIFLQFALIFPQFALIGKQLLAIRAYAFFHVLVRGCLRSPKMLAGLFPGDHSLSRVLI